MGSWRGGGSQNPGAAVCVAIEEARPRPCQPWCVFKVMTGRCLPWPRSLPGATELESARARGRRRGAPVGHDRGAEAVAAGSVGKIEAGTGRRRAGGSTPGGICSSARDGEEGPAGMRGAGRAVADGRGESGGMAGEVG
ncbi:unnamed protein product [Urochloa humidicola]